MAEFKVGFSRYQAAAAQSARTGGEGSPQQPQPTQRKERGRPSRFDRVELSSAARVPRAAASADSGVEELLRGSAQELDAFFSSAYGFSRE